MDTNELDPAAVKERARQIQEMLKLIVRGEPRTTACRWTGIPWQLFKLWYHGDPYFAACVKDAEEQSVENMAGIAYVCARKALNDPRYQRFLIFYMKCKGGWSEKPQKKAIDWDELSEQKEVTAGREEGEYPHAEWDLLDAALDLIHDAAHGISALPVEASQTDTASFTTTGDGAVPDAPDIPLVGAQRAAPSENSGKTVQNVQASGEAIFAGTSIRKPVLSLPKDLKSEIQNPPTPVGARHAVPSNNPDKLSNLSRMSKPHP